MAAGKPKAGTNQAKSASENRTINNGRKPSSRTAILEQKKQLRQRKSDQTKHRESKDKELKNLKKKIEDVKARISQEENEEKRGELEGSLKSLLSDSAQIEKDLEAVQSDIMDIDSDIAKIDKGEPMETDDTENWIGGNGEMTSRHGGENESATNGNLEQSPQNESAGQPTTDVQTHDSGLSAAHDGPRQTTINGDDLETGNRPNEDQLGHNTQTSSDGLFVSQTEPSIENQDSGGRPRDYKDYVFIDLTSDDDDRPNQLFEDGTVILKKNSRSGTDYLNSYGPRNSAMTVWSSSASPNEVEKCTFLKGDPHREAMAEDATGKLLYKDKIQSIKKVAWQPRDEGTTMLDIVESVRELNPEIKKTNPKYRYPFTSILVDWKAGVNLPPLWINRSSYKKLSGSARTESARTDRKVYAVALTQVKNYRDWAGERLDNDWAGEKREGKDQSATPFLETPAPEEELLGRGQNTQGQIIQGQNAQSQNAQSQNTTSQHGSSNGNIAETQQTQEKPPSNDAVAKKPISRFFDAYMAKKNIDLEPKDWRELGDEDFARFTVAAEVYIEDQKKQNVIVFDDMNLGRAFRVE